MSNLLKSRDITLPAKVPLVKAMVFMSLKGGSDYKVSAYNVGDPAGMPGSGRSPGEGNGNPLQYSCL